MCDRERLWKKPKKLRRIFAGALSVHVFFARRLTWIGIWLLSATTKRNMRMRTGELTVD